MAARDDLSGIISISGVGSMGLLFVFYTVEMSAAEIKKWRERGVGVMMFISIVAASIGGAFATYGRKIWAAIAG